MGRKRANHGAPVNEAIRAGVAAGRSAAEVARQSGISERTARRRMAEVRAGTAPGPATSFSADLAGAMGAAPPEVPAEADSDAELPTDKDLEEAGRGGPEAIDQMLASFVAQYEATPPGPLKKGWGGLVKDTLKEKRTGTPPVPKEELDLVAAANRARAQLHVLVDTSPEEGP